jgi:hypothetical protein
LRKESEEDLGLDTQFYWLHAGIFRRGAVDGHPIRSVVFLQVDMIVRRIIQAVVCISLGGFIAMKINEMTLPVVTVNYSVNVDNNWWVVGFQTLTMLGLILIGYLYGKKDHYV